MQVYAKTYRCPDLRTQEDAMMIQQTLINAPGIEDIEIDHAAQTVYVSCANQDGMHMVQDMLRDAGFPAED